MDPELCPKIDKICEDLRKLKEAGENKTHTMSEDEYDCLKDCLEILEEIET